MTPLFLLFSLFFFAHSSEDEFRLIKDLLNNYDPIERPVKNHSEAVTVRIKILLQQIVDVDEKNQVVTMVVWQQMKWFDYKMKWDPEEYGGIKIVQMPHGRLWKPDILLFNTADEHFDASFPVNTVVHHNGEITLAPPAIMKISCNIVLTYFPFDDQLCHLKFGSWTYTGSQVDLEIDPDGQTPEHKMSLLYYIPNGEWDLLSTPAQRKSTPFNGDKYVELYFRMHLKRRAMYYGLNWIIPSLLISLSNVLGFILPSAEGEKLTLQITNLLSVLVFLAMVSEITPPTSESIPVIAAFFSVSLVILGCSIISTILIINVHFRGPRTHVMSPWVVYVFLEWLPWLMMMQRPGRIFRKPNKRDSFESNDTNGSILTASSEKDFCAGRKVVLVVNNDDDEDTPRSRLREVVKKVDDAERKGLLSRPRLVPNDYQSTFAPLENSIGEIVNILNHLKEKVEEQEAEEDQESDWKFMAMVLDRLSLFIYSGAIIMSTVIMLGLTPAAPDISRIDEY